MSKTSDDGSRAVYMGLTARLHVSWRLQGVPFSPIFRGGKGLKHDCSKVVAGDRAGSAGTET